MTTILIVEDDPLISRMYQQAFKFDQYRVLVCDNGADGLTTAQKEKPDLVLLDVMMPKMNGLEVIKKLKDDTDTKTIPVVMLTNLGRDKDVEAALSLGAVKYLVKVDHTPQEIVHEVEKIISATTRDQIPDA